ncbi:MAG: DUF1302 family protein [Candidatus Neomarinimicrobiota bacterium]
MTLLAVPLTLLYGEIDFAGYYQNWTALRLRQDPDFMLLRNRLRLDTQIRQESLRGFVSLDLRNDMESGETDFEITLREAYIDLYFERTDLRIGKQQVVWGKADGLFINDIVCPLDMRWFLLQDFDNIRTGLTMIRADVYLGDWTFEGLWIPEFEPWKFAAQGSDWEFGFALPDTIFFGPEVVNIFHLAEPQPPESSLENSEVGVKVSTFMWGADLAFLVLDGFNDHPAAELDSIVVSNGSRIDSYLTPRYRRSRMYGLNFSRTAGPALVRGEMGYYTDRRFPSPADISFSSVSDYFQGMVGLDFTGPFKVAISVQGIRQQILDHTPDMIEDEIHDLATVVVRGSFWRETATAFLLGIFDPAEKGGLARILFDYSWVDGLSLSVGTDLLWGDETSIFGQFDPNDNLFFKVRYYF